MGVSKAGFVCRFAIARIARYNADTGSANLLDEEFETAIPASESKRSVCLYWAQSLCLVQVLKLDTRGSITVGDDANSETPWIQ
jgi:hypothetical protein